MPLDDGRMTETYCGSNIEREEYLLRWGTHNCVDNNLGCLILLKNLNYGEFIKN
jgi:hypothetical protein